MGNNNNYTSREAALISLYRICADKRYSNLELDAAIKKYRLEGAEKKLYTLLVYGTIERQITLDFVIDRLLDSGNRTLDLAVRCVLRMGVYQLLYTDRIPDSAAVNESVELCRKSQKLNIRPPISKASGLVNALLRNVIREKGSRSTDEYIDSLVKSAKLDEIAALGVKHSVCEGLVRLWVDCYGIDKTAVILGSERRDHIGLRVNTLRNTPSELCDRLNAAEDGCATLSPLSPVGLRFNGSAEVMLSAINDGLCFVEDESSQLTALALDARPDETVLDCCAAPGGKTFSIALAMEDRGRLVSRDLHKNKLRLIESGASRLGLTIVEVGERDASKPDESDGDMFDGGRFDRVLCDVPCSGSGVIFKKPELRFRDPSEYERLPELQFAILHNSASHVKPGGRLVYSTCTLNRAENEAVVERFLRERGDFECATMKTYFPDSDGTDGFFHAVLTRKA